MNPLRKMWRLSSKALLSKIGLNFINYRNNTLRNDPGLIELLMRVRLEGRSFQSFEELLNVYRLSRSTLSLAGDIAEVGVYKGGTAKLIAMNKGARLFHLFDSFEGMFATSVHDAHRHGDFEDTSLEDVKRYLADFDNILFHEGWFPDSSKGLEETRYSFVHMDLDLYQSTLDALSFFFPRINPGGVILSHDYNSISCPGVSKAFREYFSARCDSVIELAGTTQCFVIKSQ